MKPFCFQITFALLFLGSINVNAQISFQEITGTPFDGVQQGSSAIADIDGDNDQDLLITGLTASNQRIAKLYANDGAGSFTLVTGTPFDGVTQGSIAFADIDGDNDQDVLITGLNGSGQRISKLYTNDGTGSFTLAIGTPFDGVMLSSIAFSDIDGDNDQDVLISGLNPSGGRIAKLYTNDGLGSFTLIAGTPFDGVQTSSIAFADIDGDNDQDALITGRNASDQFIAKLYNNNSPQASVITPDIASLADISEQCQSTPTAPTANMGALTGTPDVAFPIISQGTTVVTWTYDDGNTTETQTQNIILADTVAPTITCAADVSGLVGDDIVLAPPTVSDNCSGTGNALNFDGVNDYVSIGNVSDLNFERTDAFSIEASVKSTGNGFEMIYSKLINGGTYRGYELWSNNGNISVYIISTYPSNSIDINTSTAPLADGQWHHVAMSYSGNSDASGVNIYVDGVLQSKTVLFNNLSGSIQTTVPALLGTRASTGNFWDGTLDEVRVWNTERTQAEIQANMNNELSTATGLVAAYHFNEGVTDGNNAGVITATDASGNGNDGTLINFALTGATSNWVEGNVLATPIVTNDAPATYPIGDTTVTWAATDAAGNMATCEQMVTIQSPTVTYTYTNGWLPNDPSGVATADDDIVIETGDAMINSNTTCNSVTVNPGAGLTVNTGVTLTATVGLVLESSATSFSSLILDGTVAGTMTYERHVNINGSGSTGSNDLVSAPLTGQDFASFATANPNILNNGALYLFGPFEKITGQYVNWAATETATLDASVGYRTGTTDNGTVTFTGTAENGIVTNDIQNAGSIRQEWNLVGNPYPSYMNVQQFLNHDVGGVSNIQLFDAATAAIYGYDGTALNGWTIYNSANTTASTLIAPGQGFFVSADFTNASSYDLEFTPAMRSTGSGDDFISGRNAELIYLKLKASTTTNSFGTDFYFNTNSSLGFDVGYDANIWGDTTPSFAIYSHLAQDNIGDAIALQSVDMSNLSDVIIPLGVHANQGEQISFSIAESTLPASVNVYLEDTVANTTTVLNTGDYVITPTTNLSGTGRFFLRTSEGALSTIDNNLDTLNIFALNTSKELVVSGQLKDATALKLYDIHGRLVLSTALDNSNLENRVDVSNLSGGVYVVNVQNNAQQKSQKIVLK